MSESPATDRVSLLHSGLLFVGFFCILLCLRFEVVWNPPYWDSLVGLFAEAIWLSKNGFDFLKLAFEQQGYAWGGPRVYFFTIYPSFEALLLRLINDEKVFLLVNHLLTFSFSALSLVYFYRILRQQCTPGLSFLGCLLLLAHPLFIAQSDAMNMEMPLLAVTMIAIDCMVHGRVMAGVVMALAAMYIKPTGILCVVTLFIVSLLVPDRSRRTRWLVRAFFFIGMVLFAGQWFIQRSFYREMSE